MYRRAAGALRLAHRGLPAAALPRRCRAAPFLAAAALLTAAALLAAALLALAHAGTALLARAHAGF